MYLARFAYENIHLLTAAFTWHQEKGPLLPNGWVNALMRQTKFDFALRVETTEGGRKLLLLVNAEASAETDLHDFCSDLLAGGAPPGIGVPSNAEEFDISTGGIPSPQMRVNYQGYHHGGHALACDFRLHPMLAGHCSSVPAFYQIHLRPHRPDKETERRVLKHLAWLDIEQPFSDPVRAMQRMLVGRLCHRGFLACEYLTTPREDDLEAWRDRIGTFFDQTSGKIGFPQAPLETGDFSDFLTVGCHPARFCDGDAELPEWAASVFDDKEVSFLLSSDMCQTPRRGASNDMARAHPDVFISYASSDYPSATAVCRSLEESGVVCWIAPRDIDRGILPYTEAIQLGISHVQAVVVVLSNAANLSVHIPREIDLALERKLSILPVRLSDVTPAGQLNYLLRTCQWLNVYGREFPAAMEELVARLRGLLG